MGDRINPEINRIEEEKNFIGVDYLGNSTANRLPEFARIRSEFKTVQYSSLSADDDDSVLFLLAIALSKVKDPLSRLGLIASAVRIILGLTVDVTGATSVITPLEFEKHTAADATANDEIEEGSFKGPVTVAGVEITLETWETIDIANPMEIYGYWGIVVMALVKRATEQGHEKAFITNRAATVSAFMGEETLFFKRDNKLLSYPVLNSLQAISTTYPKAVGKIIMHVADKLGDLSEGKTALFAVFFGLTRDYGCSHIVLCFKALSKGYLDKGFPELRSEKIALLKSTTEIQKAPVNYQPFVKAITGRTFSPIRRETIENLVGCSKYIMMQFEPSWEHYGGGVITEDQKIKINKAMKNEESSTESRD